MVDSAKSQKIRAFFHSLPVNCGGNMVLFAFVTEKREFLETLMRSTTLALTLAMTAAASADLYSLEFTAVADFVAPVTGQLTLDLDELGAGSFLGTVGTTFGPASADGTAAFFADPDFWSS